ncbi:hypothetical protein PR001_g24381 [Phytophthora rubi]|uniref:Peptidase A2 domain-containing protein n=1 Tax=Phytophthora rubi TaxID=129364 RepID=A0A6A3IAL1_9STRA|nr:hypothetical protein PR001_g24381 [Phytophthora rubi]
MLHEAGYEFLNQVPAWYTLSELSSVPESQIRLEIERIGYIIEAELVAWNTAVSSTTPYVRSFSESQLLASVQTAESQVGFPLDTDSDAIVDKDTQLFLGAEVVLRLRMTGLRARGSVSRIQDKSSGKRQLVSAGGATPKGRDSSGSVSETRSDFAKGSEHSMVDVGPSSDTLFMVTDKAVNLSGLSSSGSSLMSVTDVMIGTGTHMPMSGATVMRGPATGMTRSSFPGMAIAVTSPVSSTSVQTGTGTLRPEHLAQISLPGSPESKRRDEQNVEVDETRPIHQGYSGGRPDSDRFISFGTSAEVSNFDQQYQRDLTRSTANIWTDFDAEQSRKMATEVRLKAALADSRDQSTVFHEEYLKCKAASTQLSEAQQKVDVDYWKQVGDLEKVADRHVAEAAEMRKTDETRAPYYLGALKELQEAEGRAKQAELQMIHDERAAKIQVQYELGLLRLNAQAQAEHDRAVAERDEKIQRCQMAQEQLGARTYSSDQVVSSISPSTQTRVLAETLMVPPVIELVLAKLDLMFDLVHQLDRANMSQVGSARSSGKTTEARGLSQSGLVEAKSHTSDSVSKRIGNVRATEVKKRDGDRWDSDASSCGDSSQDELKSQFGPAAQTKNADTCSRTHELVQNMAPLDALEFFDERASLEDRVNWWERFMYYATMVPWDEKARSVQLKMRLSGYLEDWCAQLPDSTRLDWNRLSHVFKTEWCRSIDSKAEQYYAMTMHDSATPRKFLYRLNRAAKKADIAFDELSTDREAHICRFINTLGDTRLRTTLRGQRFDSLSELEETLKRIEGLNQDVRREDQVYEQKLRPAQNMLLDRCSPQQRRADSRVPLTEGFGGGADTGDHAHFRHEVPYGYDENIEVELTHQAPRTDALETQSRRAVQHSISAEPCYSTAVNDDENFRAAERLACKPRSEYPPYGALQRGEIRCSEGGSKRHESENCWSKLICGRCNDEGHPTQYCRSQVCSKCGDYHRRGLCDMWSALKVVRDKTRVKGSVRDFDPETIRLLLDSSDPEKPVGLVQNRVIDGPKFQGLCAFAYVGPALPCWRGDTSKCMSSANQASDYPCLTEVEDSISELEFENDVEFALTYGDRHGWWSDHVLVGGKRDTAMVHGAICNRRTQIWMDTGAMTSIMSLDLARKLKLKLRRGYRLRVSGFGDVRRYATAKATIKLALGVGVTYVMDIWVGNIGAGLDCLLGMDYMIAAGVRLCARKGVVRLPDEESLFLVGGTEINHVGLEIDVSLDETVRLQPGRSVVLPVKYHQAKPDKVEEWSGRGDQWVTQFIYGPGRKPNAVKVVNISDQVARITQHTVVACLVENGHFPQGECFVRPRSRKYHEWSALVYAAEPSAEYLRLEELVARQAELRGPPVVERPTYIWPKKLLLAKRSPKKDDAQSDGPEPKVSVYMVNTNPPVQPMSMLSQGRNASIWPPLPPGDPLLMNTESKLPTVTEVGGGSQSETSVAESIPMSDDSKLEVVSRRMAGGGIATEEAQCELERMFKAEHGDFVADPVPRLCTELLNDLGHRLVTLPELNDPSPKRDLTTVDIGEPGVTIPAIVAQVCTVLETHHSSFQGDGNAVPGPAKAKRPQRKNGDEFSGGDPRASTYLMNTPPGAIRRTARTS